jgi:hypothetical protein
MSARTFFFPGNRVWVILGEDIGLPGEVVSVLDAIALWQEGGHVADSFAYRPGQVCVVVPILGEHVPMALDAAQLKADPTPFPKNDGAELLRLAPPG